MPPATTRSKRRVIPPSRDIRSFFTATSAATTVTTESVTSINTSTRTVEKQSKPDSPAKCTPIRSKIANATPSKSTSVARLQAGTAPRRSLRLALAPIDSGAVTLGDSPPCTTNPNEEKPILHPKTTKNPAKWPCSSSPPPCIDRPRLSSHPSPASGTSSMVDSGSAPLLSTTSSSRVIADSESDNDANGGCLSVDNDNNTNNKDENEDENEDDDEDDDDLPELPPLRSLRRRSAGAKVATPPLTPQRKKRLISSRTPLNRRFNDLSSLFQDQQNYNQAQAVKARQEAELELYEKTPVKSAKEPAAATGTTSTPTFRATSLSSPRNSYGDLASRLFKDGDSEKRQRTRKAIENIKASVRDHSVWYFFPPCCSPLPAPPPFPAGAPQQWSKLLADPELRARNLASGAVTTLAVNRGVPDDVAVWALQQLAFEPLAHSRRRLSCMLLAITDEQIAAQLTAARVRPIFATLGARDTYDDIDDNDGSDKQCELLPVAAATNNPYSGRDWQGLLAILQFLAQVAPRLTDSAAMALTKLVLQMTADETLMDTPGVLEAVQGLLVALTDRCPDDGWHDYVACVVAFAVSVVRSPCLRAQILNCLATDAPRLRALQYSFATAFLFNRPISAVDAIDDFVTRFASPDFTIHAQTDYVELRQLLFFFETALRGATPGFHTALLNSPSCSLESAPGAHSACEIVEKVGKEGDEQQAELMSEEPHVSFNSKVDKLVAAATILRNSVKSANAAHVERLYVKTFLVCMIDSLNYAVRTEPPKRLDYYDEVDMQRHARQHETAENEQQQQQKQRLFMKDFLFGGAAPGESSMEGGEVG